MANHDYVHQVMEQWRREVPQLDRSAFRVVGRISRLAHLLEPELEAVFAEHGLTGGEFDVLAALRRVGTPYRLTPTQLRKALVVTSGGLTKRLNALSDRGLIRRDPDQADRRSNAVVLSQKGKQLVELVLPRHTANEERLLQQLPRRPRAQLAALLEELALAIGDDAESAMSLPVGRRSRRS